MQQAADFIVKALQIILLNLVLSGDNVGVIALAIKNLAPKAAKKANLVGVSIALILRILFVVAISVLLGISWLHVDLIGGVLLLYITWNMVAGSGGGKAPKQAGSFWHAVAVIVLADASMSLDNVLAIASVATGGSKAGITGPEFGLILFGLAMCVPIIFFGSEIVARLMNSYPVIIYICAGLLVHTAVKMIAGDSLLHDRLESISPVIAPVTAAVCGIAVIVAGIIYVTRHKKVSQLPSGKK